MKGPDWRDEAASSLVVRHLDELGLGRRVLLMEDPRADVAEALTERGVTVSVWWRRAFAGRRASSWPPAGPFDDVGLRLPRAKEELEMLLHAAWGMVRPEGRLIVYGARDEGAGSASSRVEELFHEARTVATGGRCRIILALGPRSDVAARPSLSDWALKYDFGLPELPGDWVSFPGMFAHGRLDGGTALLLESLPSLRTAARILDFGCGHGVIGAVAGARTDGATVEFVDVDTVALEAVSLNVPGAKTITSDGWEGVKAPPYDLIVSNPPYHSGKSESLRAVEVLVAGCPGRLRRKGELLMVVQRRLAVRDLLDSAFDRVDPVGDNGPWRVWRARGPRRADGRRAAE